MESVPVKSTRKRNQPERLAYEMSTVNNYINGMPLQTLDSFHAMHCTCTMLRAIL